MAEGVPFDRKLKVGIMIETPSAVIMASELAYMVDFFNIGTNDLTQYLLAADRTDPQASGPYSSYYPTVVRSIWWVANAAHKAGRWCGLCGAMGSDRIALELLVGLGLDELSVLPESLDSFAHTVHNCEFQACQEMAEQAVGMDTLEEVLHLLPTFGQPAYELRQAGATG